ncbi:MAG: hypothetical protein IIB28_08865 [Chloroflexi bacterium]|nr:hypothetical protein [Chloroflexota bacterium]
MADQVMDQRGGLRNATAAARAALSRAASREAWSSIARPLGLILIAQLAVSLLFLLNNTSGEIPGFSRLPIDEAWVRMVYARNFGDSFELAFTPGDLSPGATSLLWVVLLGGISAVTDPIGLSIVTTAKLLSIVFATTSALLVFLILQQLTRVRRLAMLGALVVAIEPTFGFASVSGMEVTLYSTLALGAALSFLRGKHQATGILFGLMVITRPESWIFVIFAALTLMGRRLWDRNEIQLFTRGDAIALRRLVGPALLLSLIWVGANLAISGAPLPSAYYAAREDMGLLPFGNIGNILRGYYHHLAFFSGAAFPVTAFIFFWGAIHLIREHKFAGALIALFVVAQTYAIAANLVLGPDEFTFVQRRYLDPMIPFIVILLIIGLLQASRKVREWSATRAPADPTEARIFNFSLNSLMLFVIAVPFIGFGTNLKDLPGDYSWNTRNINETLVDAARWIDENTPADARIGTGQPGALAYFSNREILDFTGKQFEAATNKSVFEIAEEEDIDYAFAFASVYLDSWPAATDVFSTVTERNTILVASEFKGWTLDFERETVIAPNSTAYQIDFEARNFVVIDMLDVGNANAPPAETEAVHEYVLGGVSIAISQLFNIDDVTTLEEDARTYTTFEEFKVSSSPGERLIIAKRYDAAIGQSLRVFADDQEVEIWELPRKDFFFGEEIFVIPGELITSNRTELRFEFVPGPGSTQANSFFYWILKDA